MASKGQKFRKYTEEFRQKVLEEYFNGDNVNLKITRNVTEKTTKNGK